jgi:potassium efflux system protein
MTAFPSAAIGSTQEASSKPLPTNQAEPDPRRAAANSNEGNRTSAPSEAEIAALRTETSGQLQAINPSASSAPSPPNAPGTSVAPPATGSTRPSTESASDKQLRETLQERLRLLEEYDKASAAFKKANSPEPSAEKQADEVRSELAKLQALLTQAAKTPDVLLPEAFRASTAGGKSSVNAEMKGAIEAATGELKECKAKLETLRTEVSNWENQQNARRSERDRLFQVVVAMKTHGPERVEPGAAATTSASSQGLAHGRLVNAAWKSRVAAMRLQAMEARIALEAKLAGVREVSVQVGQAQVQVAEKALELMQSRYSAAAERQERLLKARAADEENRAEHSRDPLEQFRARRRADLLALEATVIKHEEALATSPPPSLDEQTGLADRAAFDFARVKELLDDGRVSRLDAIRLNNDFRRIGPERERLLRNEMAVAEARLQFYEDTLTSVEIELLQDSLHDRYELDLLKERIAATRFKEAEGMLADLEQNHRTLLVRRRKVLEQLTDGTAQTLDQIARRLAILDEEYSFIRTHIFWVRDREPIGPATITQGAREGQHVLKALIRLVQESARPSNWGRPSAEFVAASLAVLGLPIGLFRLRRVLRAQIACDFPAGGPKTA